MCMITTTAMIPNYIWKRVRIAEKQLVAERKERHVDDYKFKQQLLEELEVRERYMTALIVVCIGFMFMFAIYVYWNGKK